MLVHFMFDGNCFLNIYFCRSILKPETTSAIHYTYNERFNGFINILVALYTGIQSSNIPVHYLSTQRLETMIFSSSSTCVGATVNHARERLGLIIINWVYNNNTRLRNKCNTPPKALGDAPYVM